MASLGCGYDHVLDAVSQCEQIHRDGGGREAEAPWALYLRKEAWAAWEQAGDEDPVAARLISVQVTRGIMLGELPCDVVSCCLIHQ